MLTLPCLVHPVCSFLISHRSLTVLVPLREWFTGVSRTHLYSDPCVCLTLTSLMHGSLCSCLSHPLMAAHLYKSNTSIEIDSSDGMISDPSTKDSSSSSEESRSSDEDDGDDSSWGGRDVQSWQSWVTPCQSARTLFIRGWKSENLTGSSWGGGGGWAELLNVTKVLKDDKKY